MLAGEGELGAVVASEVVPVGDAAPGELGAPHAATTTSPHAAAARAPTVAVPRLATAAANRWPAADCVCELRTTWNLIAFPSRYLGKSVTLTARAGQIVPGVRPSRSDACTASRPPCAAWLTRN